MNVRILASGTRGNNSVSLLELDSRVGYAFYIVTLYVHDRAGKPQTWARTDLAADVARELYDVAVAEFISPHVEPSFHWDHV